MESLDPCSSGKSVVKSPLSSSSKNHCDLVRFTAIWRRKQHPRPPGGNKWLTAHSGGDGSRHARRPVQVQAAPTAFQRTSLHPKYTTELALCNRENPFTTDGTSASPMSRRDG